MFSYFKQSSISHFLQNFPCPVAGNYKTPVGYVTYVVFQLRLTDAFVYCIVDSTNFLLILPTVELASCSASIHCLEQWCTTSGPRATSGPRRVLVWPAVSNKKSEYFKSRHLVYNGTV